MEGEVKLNEVASLLSELSYPVTKAEAMEATAGVTLRYADGEEELSTVIERAQVEEFGSSDDLEAEVFNLLPTEAVGEPGQSEGEG